MARPKGIPGYHHHKASGQARVRIDGQDIYLGPHGSETSRKKYAEVIAKLETIRASGETIPLLPGTGGTVAEVIAAYLQHADTWYRKHGEPTAEIKRIEKALALVHRRFGRLAADEFGRRQLEQVRADMIERGWCRRYINQLVGCIRRCFAWAAEQDLVSALTLANLKVLKNLKQGRTPAPESKDLAPVAWEHVEPILPYLLPPLAIAVQVQWWTGMRTFELLQLRPVDIDRQGDAWVFRPKRTKLEHLGIRRDIVLGPQAQRLLAPLLLQCEPEGYLFSPRRALAQRAKKMRAARKTRVQPSQKNRRKKAPRRAPKGHYTTDSYSKAVTRAIERANAQRALDGLEAIPHFRPYAIRHAAATRIRRDYGLDAARAVLGHKSLAMTDHYAELDLETARQAMRKSG